MSEHQLAVIGTAVVYISVFGFASFLVLWTLNCWWRVFQVIKGIGPLIKYVHKLKKKELGGGDET